MSTAPTTEAPPDAPAASAPDIDDQVLALLLARKGEWNEIAEKSGVSYSWVSKFANGHIPGPKVDTLKKLRAWLLANPAPATAPASAVTAEGTSLHGASSEPPA